MFKQSSVIIFLVFINTIQCLPKNRNDSRGDSMEVNSIRQVRQNRMKIDGSTHQVKSTGITYRQRIQDEHCFVEYDGQVLAELSVIHIRKRYYRVEDCLLERVFHACGPNLIYMLNIVCRVVEQDQYPLPKDTFNGKRYISSESAEHSPGRNPRTITESCCENLCNVAELTRYCHKQ